jgi:uncharacterized membrane protein
MKLSWRVELVQLLIIAAMFAVAAWAWPQVPDRIPIHWNIRGEVDGWGGKTVGLFLLPFISLGMYALTLFLPRLDPNRANYQSFPKAYNAIRITLLLFFAVIYAVVVLTALGRKPDMNTVVLIAMGLLFVVLGNFMSKIRPNWFVGVRTPWTLSSTQSWNKTHRLAGWLFLLMGLMFFVLAFQQTFWMLIAVLTFHALAVVSMLVYSYLVYRRDPQRVHAAAISPDEQA